MFGFGGKPRMPNLKSNEVLHCFPLTGDPLNCEAIGLEGIIETYLNAINTVEFDGPTYFNQIIQQTMNLSQYQKDNDTQEYYILLILTDGMYHDRSQTKRSIVKASDLPLSIIIVGIGNDDFTDMEELDGDSGLQDDRGEKALRDIVQFVPFNQFKNDGKLLAQQVLEELPNQLVEYMELIGKSIGNESQFEIEENNDCSTDKKLNKNTTMRSFTMPVQDDESNESLQISQKFNSQFIFGSIEKQNIQNLNKNFQVRRAKKY